MRLMVLLLLFLASRVQSQPLSLSNAATNTDASFRALSVVSDSIAWVGGTKGTVGRTTNGGITWSFTQVAQLEKADFRSLYAFNDQKALIANAGSPAHILLTMDGGVSWKEVYKNEHPDAFFDGIDFWNNQEGVIYGDPMQGRMLMLQTTDGGLTWQENVQAPVVSEGEASFASSGTGIRCMDQRTLLLATGGKVSRLFLSNDKGMNWRQISTPIIQGESTTGIFSVSFMNTKQGIIVGGDYKRDTLRVNHVFFTQNGGKDWMAPKVPTRGYRECVEYINSKLVIATGPGGMDISRDGGKTWLPFSDEKGFSVVRKARKGKLILAAGGKGKIAVLR